MLLLFNFFSAFFPKTCYRLQLFFSEYFWSIWDDVCEWSKDFFQLCFSSNNWHMSFGKQELIPQFQNLRWTWIAHFSILWCLNVFLFFTFCVFLLFLILIQTRNLPGVKMLWVHVSVLVQIRKVLLKYVSQ